MATLMRFLCMLAVLPLAFGVGAEEPAKERAGVVTLPSGDRIMVRGIGRNDQTVGRKQALTMIYYSTIELSDTARLRAQAIEVWRAYFGVRADREDVAGAILFVRHAPPPPPRKPGMAHFVFVRQHDGSWRIDDPGEYLGYPKDYGVARAEAGWKLQEAGEHDRAIPLYTQALAAGFLMKDQKAAVLSNRCWAYNATGAAPDLAIADCRAAVALKPAMAGAQMNLASAYTRARRFDEADAAFRAALDHAGGDKPYRAEILKERARLNAARGRRTAAMADIDRAIELMPNSATAQAARCDLLRRLGGLRRAMQACDKALELALKEKQGNSAGIVLYTRGLVLEQQGARSRAEEAFRRAFEIDPEDPRIRARAKQIGALKR